MREIRLSTEREHQRFLDAMEKHMSEQDLNNEQLAAA